MSHFFSRIEANLKKKSTAILKNLGIDTTTAINIFLRQVVINNGIIPIKAPAKTAFG